jgi:hypothetical protein
MVRKIGRKYIKERISAIKNGEVSDDIMTSAIKENGKDFLSSGVEGEVSIDSEPQQEFYVA